MLTYKTAGHLVELSQIMLDGWCATGNPTEDPTSFLLAPEPAQPVCGTGPTGHAWPPITTFTYSNATPSPTYHAISTPFQSRPIPCSNGTLCQQRGASLLDVNADGLPDVVDSPTLAGSQTVYLNSAKADGSAVAAASFTPYPLLFPASATTLLDIVSSQMQPFSPNYTAGAFLNDARADALVFDPRWSFGSLSTASSVGAAMYTLRPTTSGGSPAYTWGLSSVVTSPSIMPYEIQNCAGLTLNLVASTLQDTTWYLTACGTPWMYLGTDSLYGTLDIDGDGLQDLLLSSEYGAGYAVPQQNQWNGVPTSTSLSDYYTFVTAKFTSRATNGIVAPFATPPPQKNPRPIRTLRRPSAR